MQEKMFGAAFFVTKEHGWKKGMMPVDRIYAGLNGHPIQDKEQFPIVFDKPIISDKPVDVTDVFIPIKVVFMDKSNNN